MSAAMSLLKQLTQFIEEKERELAEADRKNAVLANQLDDALDEVFALRAQLVDREAVMARTGANVTTEAES